MSKISSTNAVAGPSRSTTSDRSKSFGQKLTLDLKKVKSRDVREGGQIMGNMNGTVPFSAPLPPTAGTGRSTGTGMRIRAVPPSAAFDPPTPPESPQEALPTAPVTAGTIGTTASRRPKLRLRYSSSESDADDDDTDSEEEVPWWTFTNLGMARMRQRMAGERSRAAGQGRATTIAGAAAQVEGKGGRAGSSATGGPASGGMSGGESEGGKHSHSYTQYKERMKDRFHRKASRDESSPTPKPSKPPSRSASSTGLAHLAPTSNSAPSASIPALGLPIGEPSTQNTSDTEAALPPVSPDAGRKRSKPSPIRSLSHFTSDHIFRRGSDRSDSHSDVDKDGDNRRPRFPARRVFARSNSAPGSPMDMEELVESPVAGATPLASTPPNELGVGGMGQDASSHSLPAIAHRQLSVESNHPGRLHPGHVSDTEAHVPKRSRLKSRLGQMHSAGAMSSEAEEEGHGSGSGSATPRADRRGSNGRTAPIKMRRMNTAQLKLRLPPPITQTLAHGWPHAGSWQDALREEKDRTDTGNTGVVKVKEKGKRGSYHVRVEDRRRSAPEATADGMDGVNGAENAPRTTDNEGPISTPKTPRRVGRRKTRRMRRYREALVPPTPNGLGFEPRQYPDDGTVGANANSNTNVEAWKEGRPGAGEFSWSTPTAVPEGDELSRSETRMSGKENAGANAINGGAGGYTEKSRVRTTSTLRSKKKKGPRMRRSTTATRFRDPWQVRLKRTMFLDARVTIYIRLLTIMVVTVALALAITIRQSLINIHLPGLIGPSTVLIIAFSCLTLLHGMMAIYREYVGKPIGLWGLRSKMLWVCLDIAFVALWSSVLSLSINDYISTPLQCDRQSPWWTAGLSGGYARLLQDLGLDASDDVAGLGLTSVDLIKATLGIVLPEQVISSSRARGICYRQRGEIGLTLLSMLLYGGNMVLSLFRIFETVRRHAQQERPPVVV